MIAISAHEDDVGVEPAACARDIRGHLIESLRGYVRVGDVHSVHDLRLQPLVKSRPVVGNWYAAPTLDERQLDRCLGDPKLDALQIGGHLHLANIVVEIAKAKRWNDG